jgi:hypothetical protein
MIFDEFRDVFINRSPCFPYDEDCGLEFLEGTVPGLATS